MADFSVQTFDLDIAQGATYVNVFTWLSAPNPQVVGSQSAPVDLTGYTAAMQIRPYALSSMLFYDASSNIVLGGTAGTITLTIPASSTETFTWWNGVYDLLLTSPSGVVTRFVSGSVTVSPTVTT